MFCETYKVCFMNLKIDSVVSNTHKPKPNKYMPSLGMPSALHRIPAPADRVTTKQAPLEGRNRNIFFCRYVLRRQFFVDMSCVVSF